MKLPLCCTFLMALLAVGCQGSRSLTSEQCPGIVDPSSIAAPYSEAGVDTPAEPRGGMRAIHQEVRYPESAKRTGVQGEVLVGFVVDTGGCVLNARVLRGPDDRLNDEALRVVQKARFEPARLNGIPVPMAMTLPISFAVRFGF